MKLKERLIGTDFFLLAGLFMAFIKACNILSVVLSIPESLDNLLSLGMCGCYGIHVLLQKYSWKRLAAYAAAVLVGFYSARRSGDMMGLNTLFTCIALAGSDFDKIMDKLFRWNICFLVLNVITSLIMAVIDGPMDNLIHIYNDGYWETGWALHLGYGHKNNMGLHTISTFLMWVWNHYKDMKIKPVLIFSISASAFFFLTMCKAACGVLLVITIALIFLRVIDRKNYRVLKKLAQLAAAFGPTALFAFSFGSAWLYRQGSAFAQKLSVLSTGRVALCATAWDQYGLTFWGHLASDVAQVENRILLMDNAYLYAMVQIGAIWAIAFCVAFLLLALRSKDSRVYLFILCWCMYSVVEITVYHCLFLIAGIIPALLLAPSSKNNIALPSTAESSKGFTTKRGIL